MSKLLPTDERREIVHEYKMRGYSNKQIAEKMRNANVTRGRLPQSYDVSYVKRDLNSLDLDNLDKLRLDHIIQNVWSQIALKDYEAIRIVLDAIELRDKLGDD